MAFWDQYQEGVLQLRRALVVRDGRLCCQERPGLQVRYNKRTGQVFILAQNSSDALVASTEVVARPEWKGRALEEIRIEAQGLFEVAAEAFLTEAPPRRMAPSVAGTEPGSGGSWPEASSGELAVDGTVPPAERDPARSVSLPRDECLELSEIAAALTKPLPTQDRPEDGPFTIYVPIRVISEVCNHAIQGGEHEVGGLLVGDVAQDDRGRVFVVMTGILEAEGAEESTAHVTMTAEALSRMASRRAQEFPNAMVLGWYHSHPGYGAFLSTTDRASFRSVFPLSYQLALVVDHKRREEKFFIKDGADVREVTNVLYIRP